MEYGYVIWNANMIQQMDIGICIGYGVWFLIPYQL